MHPHPCSPFSAGWQGETSCFDQPRVEERERCLPCTWLLLTTAPPRRLPPRQRSILFFCPLPLRPSGGRPRGREQRCTLTCLDATASFFFFVLFCSPNFFGTQVKSQHGRTMDSFLCSVQYKRKEKVITVTLLPFYYHWFFFSTYCIFFLIL